MRRMRKKLKRREKINININNKTDLFFDLLQ